MSQTKWYAFLILLLLALSAFFYLLQVQLFMKIEDTLFYLLQDLSFVPIQVLIVTLILDRLLKRREKQALMTKLNMVIGVFFHDAGYELIGHFTKFTDDFKAVAGQLTISASWKDDDFTQRIKSFTIQPEHLSIDSERLESLKNFLIKKKDGLLVLLANPNLLEHETFTNLLWAVFHLADELQHRESLRDIPESDVNHLRGDLVRAYKLLICEWLAYVRNLKKDYPYLYSIAIRVNPFNTDRSIVVK